MEKSILNSHFDYLKISHRSVIYRLHFPIGSEIDYGNAIYGGQVLKLFANVPEGVCSDFGFGDVCFISPGQLVLVFMFFSFVVLT